MAINEAYLKELVAKHNDPEDETRIWNIQSTSGSNFFTDRLSSNILIHEDDIIFLEGDLHGKEIFTIRTGMDNIDIVKVKLDTKLSNKIVQATEYANRLLADKDRLFISDNEEIKQLANALLNEVVTRGIVDIDLKLTALQNKEKEIEIGRSEIIAVLSTFSSKADRLNEYKGLRHLLTDLDYIEDNLRSSLSNEDLNAKLNSAKSTVNSLYEVISNIESNYQGNNPDLKNNNVYVDKRNKLIELINSGKATLLEITKTNTELTALENEIIEESKDRLEIIKLATSIYDGSHSDSKYLKEFSKIKTDINLYGSPSFIPSASDDDRLNEFKALVDSILAIKETLTTYAEGIIKHPVIDSEIKDYKEDNTLTSAKSKAINTKITKAIQNLNSRTDNKLDEIVSSKTTVEGRTRTTTIYGFEGKSEDDLRNTVFNLTNVKDGKLLDTPDYTEVTAISGGIKGIVTSLGYADVANVLIEEPTIKEITDREDGIVAIKSSKNTTTLSNSITSAIAAIDEEIASKKAECETEIAKLDPSIQEDKTTKLTSLVQSVSSRKVLLSEFIKSVDDLILLISKLTTSPTLTELTPTKDGFTVKLTGSNEDSTFRIYDKSGTKIKEGKSPITVTGLTPNTQYTKGDYLACELINGTQETNKLGLSAFKTLPISVESVSFNPSVATIKVGETVDLNVVVSPQNATNKKYTLIPDEDPSATLEGNTLTAVSKGTKVVRVTTEDGNKEASFTLTVEENTPEPEPEAPTA